MIAAVEFVEPVEPAQTLLFGETARILPPRAPKKPKPTSLDAGTAELVRRRLEALEGPEYSQFFQGVDLDDWEVFCRVVCPERFAVPDALPDEPALIWGPEKADVLAGRLRGKNSMTRQNPLKQNCLWHVLDVDSRPDYCGLFCEPSWGKKKRHVPKPRTVEERLAAGEIEEPANYHAGMQRIEDCFMVAAEDYKPARQLIGSKGDEKGGGGEGAKTYREVRAG